MQALGRSPLCSLSVMPADQSAAAELRALLVDVVAQMAADPRPPDAESGRVLLDYYVKRVGSHEAIMERLYLSRPTFYRRLNRGLTLVAERLAQFEAAAAISPTDESMTALAADTGFETALRLPLRSPLAEPVRTEMTARQSRESRSWSGQPGTAHGVWS